MRIKFRPHHFLCAFCFQGKGYSADFVENLQQIIKILPLSNTEIEVVDGIDSICNFCPKCHNQECDTQQKVTKLDKLHAKALGIKNGDVLTWPRAEQLIHAKINKTNFHNICSSCSWYESGLCENKLNDLCK